MYFVYILKSLKFPNKRYIGYTVDIKNRLKLHNNGRVEYTSRYLPWSLESFIGFNDQAKAVAFEQYLKSGSGRVFSQKRL